MGISDCILHPVSEIRRRRRDQSTPSVGETLPKRWMESKDERQKPKEADNGQKSRVQPLEKGHSLLLRHPTPADWTIGLFCRPRSRCAKLSAKLTRKKYKWIRGFSEVHF